MPGQGPGNRFSVVLSGGGELSNSIKVVAEGSDDGKPKKWVRHREDDVVG